MKKKLLCILVICPLFISAQLIPNSINTSNGKIGFYEFRPTGYNPDSTYEYPLIIFLHGVGERGNGANELPQSLLASLPYLIDYKKATMKFVVNGRRHAFVVLIPQLSMNYLDWPNYYIDEMIKYGKSHLKIDTNKIFLTGWSVGGGSAWKFATASIDSANLIAGIIPVSPAPDYTNLCNIARGRVAVWIHHAKDDGAVPVHFTEDAIDGINACGPEIAPMARYYTSGGHSAVANLAYDTLNTYGYPNIYQWMIGTSRANTRANNKPPVALAGQDTTVIVPSLKAVLNGSASYDPNDVIVDYKWTAVAGPSLSRLHIVQPDFCVTNVSGLSLGDYTFRLTVKDQFGAVKSDNVTIRVTLPSKGENAAPLVDAGPDITVFNKSCYIEGEMVDFDGKINSYHWRQVSGPETIKVFSYGNGAVLLGMTKTGTYGLELTASDNSPLPGSGKDTLFVTRSALRPFYFFYFSTKNTGGNHTNLLSFMMLSVMLLLVTVPQVFYNNFLMNRQSS